MPVACQAKRTPVRCQLSCCSHSWHVQPKLVVLYCRVACFCSCAHVFTGQFFICVSVASVISVDHPVKHQFVSVRLWPKMTSIVDSEAHLAKRATEVGLTDGALQSLVRSGLSTLGRLAFAHGQPGTPIDAAAFHTFAAGRPDVISWRSSVEKAPFWRAHDGAESAEGGCGQPWGGTRSQAASSGTKRKDGHITCSHARSVHWEAVGAKPWLAWPTVAAVWGTTIGLHLTWSLHFTWVGSGSMGKTSKEIKLDTDKVVVKEKSDTPDQAAATEMQIYEALRRRGIAYAFADLLEWTVHERYISQLFGHLRKDPPQGYMKTSIQQLLRADSSVGENHWRQCLSQAWRNRTTPTWCGSTCGPS